MSSGTEGRRNTEYVPSAIKHLQHLLTPLGTRSIALHSPRFEDVETPTRLSLREEESSFRKRLWLAVGGDPRQLNRTEVCETGNGFQERDYRRLHLHCPSYMMPPGANR